MCGRFTIYHGQKALEAQFSLSFAPLEARYNVAPSERICFVFSNADEKRQVGFAQWGLIPHWSKTGETDKPLFNARSETVLQKPTFRTAFARGRCLIPASGWYEWQREGTNKQPYHITSRSREPLALAGLFDVWRGEGEKTLVSCTVLTTKASDGLAWLHERMPVVLTYDDYDRWLERSTPDIAELTELLRPYPEAELKVTPVSKKVNRSDVEGAELVKPSLSVAKGPSREVALFV